MSTTNRSRRTRGQSIMSLGVVLIIVAVVVLGLLSVEVNRLVLAKQQLQSAADAAALAGAATLASSDNLDPMDAQDQASSTALNTFQKNQVLGRSLSTATIGGGGGSDYIDINFLDPHNNNAIVAPGDPKGKVVQVTANMAFRPLFAFLGTYSYPLAAISNGGVPNLDVVLCFDVSGSIDDQTPVTFIRRRWSNNKIVYDIPSTRSGSPVQPQAKGPLYDIIGPPATGTRSNGVYPQHLSLTNQSDVRWPLVFSEQSGVTGSAVGLRGTPNVGKPPGNCPPGTAGIGNQYTYTDVVVNIDGKNTFGGLDIDGYNFPDVATLVEASRGNLENNTNYVNSKANTSLPNIQPKAGYQAKYFEMAAKELHPLVDAQEAAADFFTIMNTNTDGHFGLVAFADAAGSSATSTQSLYNVDSNYTTAGTGNFATPQIVLDPTATNTNYDSVIEVLPNTRATTGTNIGDALDEAVTQIKNRSRAGSKKAIVLFTDGQPTVGQPLSSDPWTNARKAAQNANAQGIPVYTIGLAQNSEIIPGEVAILNDTNSSSSNGGIAAIAGNGGKFFLVTKTSDLRKTFENIARQLVQLVK
ncbi:MAG: VWA domain-containing protein [Candidatus Obscuribacterales bacterium]|nr:VWA domain-containing protein [Candidatus Obscuribacterales bacterium]